MANAFAAYVYSPQTWSFDSQSYDSSIGFYTNAWLDADGEMPNEDESNIVNDNSCSYFYQIGKEDETGFTPNRIMMNDANGILTIEGKQKNVASNIIKSFRMNSPSPRFLNLRDSRRNRRPARFNITSIITDADDELVNIKEYLGLNEEENASISRAEEFGAEMPDWWPEGTKEVVCPKCGARESEGGAYRSDPETTWPNGTPIDHDAIEADEHGWCDSCGGFELPDDFYEAEEFGAEDDVMYFTAPFSITFPTRKEANAWVREYQPAFKYPLKVRKMGYPGEHYVMYALPSDYVMRGMKAEEFGAESFEAKGSRKCTKHFWELASRKNPISGGMQFFNQCVLCGKKNFSRGGSAMSDRGFFAE
jgi:hypothetical protein